MKISVIAIFYNSEHVCEKCIESILSQTGNFDMEIIAVDDCSTDNTLQILKKYTDPRLKIIRHNRNLGISSSRNTGLENVTGDCFFFIDGDDSLPTYSFSRMIDEFSNDVDWGQGGYAICEENGNVLKVKNNITNKYNSHDEIIDNFDKIEFIYVHNRLINSKWKYIKFPTGKAHEDRFWNINVFPHLTKIINLSSITYNYYIYPQSFSSKSRSLKLYINSGIELLERMRTLNLCWQNIADTFQITAIEKNLYLFNYNKNYRKTIINKLKHMPKVAIDIKFFPRFTKVIHKLIVYNIPDFIIVLICFFYKKMKKTSKY